MARKVEVDLGGELGRETVEMFRGNSMLADVEMLFRLLVQIYDEVGEVDTSMYDSKSRQDWSVGEVIDYIKEKYADEFQALAAVTPSETF